jgi:hypothetical protein
VSITLDGARDANMFDRLKHRHAERKARKEKYRRLGFLITPFATPLKFIALVITTVAATYIGVQMVAGVYYLLVGADWQPLNGPWHDLVPSDHMRHLIRNVGEGLLGGILGQTVAFNYYKKVIKKRPGFLDRLSRTLRIPSAWDDKLAGPLALLLNPFAVLLFAVPGFIVGNWAVNELHHALNWAVDANQTYGIWDPSLDQRVSMSLTGEYDQKIIGFFAAFFFGRKAALGVMSDLQERFAAIRICNNKPLRFYHPPTFRARYNLLQETGVDRNLTTGPVVIMFRISLVAGLLLAAFGWYVLNYVAFGINPLGV